jgi:MYXO-CTERM domain-containing protein
MTHLWGANVNMTGGELRVNNGTSSPTGHRIEWFQSTVNTSASANTATISGRINLRGDGGGQIAVFNVADGAAATDLQVSAAVTESFDSVGITKNGAGTMELTGSNSYTGATLVTGGKLIVNGNISTSVTTVQTGGTIGGSGTVGSLIVQAGGTVAPGNSPGVLTVDGDYSQSGTLALEINGLSAGSLHDQVVVDRSSGDGTVSISGNLSVLFGGGYTPANGDLIFILLNDGTDAITGTFSGLAQNDIVASHGGYDWRISYSADASGSSFLGGNDIALVAVPEPEAALLGGLGLLALLRRRRSC